MYEDRILLPALRNKVMSAEEAAALVGPNCKVGFSGFTEIGYPKVVPPAIARLGKAKNLRAYVGGATGDELDGELVRAGLMSYRCAFQSSCKDLRNAINEGSVQYVDMHLGHLPHWMRNGMFGQMDFAIVEACMITEDGGIVPPLSVGAADSFVECCDKVIVELNLSLPTTLYGMHDIYSAGKVPHAGPIAVYDVMDRIGTPAIPCSPDKIAAIVITNCEDQYPHFAEPDAQSSHIADLIIDLLKAEVKAGRLPENLVPLQSGVGSTANAVLMGLERSGFHDLTMFTEVMQDSALKLISSGTIARSAASALSLSAAGRKLFFENLDFFHDRILLRPQDISNHPEIIRRLGSIAMNAAIEVDIYGNVNSTHIMGSSMMNGIGGSGDFCRNAILPIFITPSTAKNGKISCIVPMVSHVDHTEHDTQIIVTEQGIADLRGKSPTERAELLIENCAHPKFRPMLRDYFEHAKKVAPAQHTPVDLERAHEMHRRFLETGSML